MKKISVTDLKSGMIFDKPVYIEGNNILVPPDIPIKKKDISRLMNWNIPEVFTEGELLFSGEENEIKTEKTDFYFYEAALRDLDEVFLNAARDSLSPLDSSIIDTVAEEIYSYLFKNDDALINKIIHTRSEASKFSVSALNTAILAGITGSSLIKVRSKLVMLLKAALLHDLGMLRIPDYILNKEDRLKVDEIRTIQEHVKKSYQLILKMSYPEELGQIVLYHHEKWNGHGYPEGLKGRDIPLASRILAVADTFEALLNPRPYRPSVIGYNAMKTVLSDNSTHFDPEVLRIFLRKVGIYPLGSLVQLSDQSTGKVLVNNQKPLRPTIQLIKDGRGLDILEKQIINLSERTDLYIIRALDPRERI